MIYTDEDAINDSKLLITENVDFDMNWIGVELLRTNDGGRNNVTTQNAKAVQKVHNEDGLLLKAISSHLKNLRFLKFATETLGTELSNQNESLDMYFSANNDIKMEAFCDDGHDSLGKSQLNNRNGDNLSPFTVRLPSKVSVSKIEGIERMLQRDESIEAKEKQLKKDVERDRILLNGVRISGSEAGIDAIYSRIGQICDTVLQECSLPTLGESLKADFTRIVLSKSSRTHSGGITFQAVQAIIDPLKSMLLPQSNITPPIRIKVFVGNFPENGKSFSSEVQKSKWGLICSIVCESYFEVQEHLTLQSLDVDESESTPPQKNIIKSVYEDYVMVEVTSPVVPFSFSSFFNGTATSSASSSEPAHLKLLCTGIIVGRDIDTGTVSISKLE
eukprot:gene25709-33571_t